MNPVHEPAGTPKGGQFASGGGIVIRTDPMENDITKQAEKYKNEGTDEALSRALYDGGYIIKKNQEHSLDNGERFLHFITTKENEKRAWEGHKDLVENYLDVAKGYFNGNNYELVKSGFRSDGSGWRNATEVMDEFGLGKKKIADILMDLTADDFVSSGKNTSKIPANQGTVVMVFAPTVTFDKTVISDGKTYKKKETVSLYVKMVLNPHPAKGRGEMQVISFKEVDRKTDCLFTGEEKERRI